MNLILFDVAELTRPLPADDARARHLRDVLRRGPGGEFDCGVIDGARGRARIERIDTAGVHLAFTWGEDPPPLPPVRLLIGLPRPQTARKILNEVAALGAAELCFFATDKGEPSYAASTLWTTGEFRRHLLAGAAQAFCTRIPACSVAGSLDAALTDTSRTTFAGSRVALDNYEATEPLAAIPLNGAPAVLAVGPERGWSGRERDTLRAAGFALAHLGPRVLRTETACVAGLAVLQARLGLHAPRPYAGT